MAFWDRDEGSEWERYQKSQKKPWRQDEAAQPDWDEAASPAEEAGGPGLLRSLRQKLEKPTDAPDPPPPEPCPWCGREMTPGYLCGDQGVYWQSKLPRRVSRVLLGVSVNGICISTMEEGFNAAFRAAWFCPDCHKAVFSTDDLPWPLGAAKPSEALLNALSPSDLAAAAEAGELAQPTNKGES